MNATATKDAIDLGRDWVEASRWNGHRPRLHAAGRHPPARLPPDRADARAPRRREALAAAGGGGLRRGPRRPDRRPGSADGESRAEGDLSLGLAGRGRRQPRSRRLPRPEPLPGEQRARDGAPAQQRAPARRPDRLGRGEGRRRLPDPDRRRRGSGLRRPVERLRADEGNDRGGRRGRPLRGSALVGEEVRPPRREGARPDRASSSARSSRRGWPPTCSTCRPSSSPAPTPTRPSS